MTEPKIVSLNFGHGGGSRAQPFSYEVQRSKRKTLAIYISHRKVVVRCPLRASALELRQFVSANQQWIEKRLLEESLRDKELLRIERGGKIFCRARELEIVFKQGRKQRILISLDQFIIQGHKLNATKARIQVEDYLIDKASEYLLPLSLIHI